MSAARYPDCLCPAWRTVSFGLCCLTLLTMVVCAAPSVSAQDTKADLERDYPDWPYNYVEIPERLRDRTVQLKYRFLVQAIFRNDPDPERSLAGNESKFDEYFRDIIFRKWTHPSHLKEIANDREIVLRYLQGSKNPEAHDRLNSLITSLMPVFASGNYHPTLRYNAMLLLGSINSKEAVMFGNKSPAVPLIDVLPVLLEQAVAADQIDAVRVAALIGVQRQAEGDKLSAGAKQEVINRLLPILPASPPEGRTPEGHAWMQRQVINILAAMGSPGTGGAVINGLRTIVVDQDKPLSVRCAAAAALGAVGIGSLDPKEVAGEVGGVGFEACRVELAWLRERTEKRVAALKAAAAADQSDRGSEDALFGGGGIVTVGDPVLGRLDELSRRRLKARLNTVRAGLGGRDGDPPGISAVAGPAGPDVSRLASIIDEIMKALEDTEAAAETVQQNIYEGATKLEAQVKKMVGTGTAAPVEATTPAPDAPGPDGPAVDGPPGPASPDIDGPPGPGDEPGPGPS